MKKRFLLTIILIITLAILGIGNVIYAADYSCKLTLDATSNTIKAGDYIELILKVSDIQAGNGITIVKGAFEFDKDIIDENIFEGDNTDQINFSLCNGWNTPIMVSSMLETSTKNYEARKDSGDVFKIKLPTKSDVKDGTYNIYFKNIEIATDDSQSIKIDDLAVKVDVKSTSSENNEPENKPTNEPTKVTNQVIENANLNKSNDSVSNKILPKTGLNAALRIAIIISALSIVFGGVAYYRNRSIK